MWSTLAGYEELIGGLIGSIRNVHILRKDPLIATSVPRVDILLAFTTGVIGGVQANLGPASAMGEKAKNGLK